MNQRLVCIVVHDVAPATWDSCRTLLAMIDSLGAPSVTLLVVPHFHRGLRVDQSPAFVDALDARRARGDELALHGYFHTDDAPAPRSARDFVSRRVLTRREGEFAAIDEMTALQRLRRGVELFAALRWPLFGFIPPAWLLNAGTRDALSRCGHRFEYVPVRGGIYRLPQWQLERTANLCYSPDRGWRRAMSRAQIGWQLSRYGERRVLRLSLHPLDARFPGVVEHWRTLITTALHTRTAVTKHHAMTAALPDRYADRLTDLGGKLSGT
ncbi:MAG: polysaccharide deacetylase family protein [Casimicrobiaceae bacterium]